MSLTLNRNIFDYLPREYEELRESHAILSAEQAEFERLHANTNDLLDQFFVASATWGLAHWERMAGVQTDVNKPLSERRSVIIAKLRGAGVASAELIKNVAESWYGGETEVREVNSEYRLVVKFVSSLGIPSNLGDVETALREIIPAHLDVEFEFTYLLIRDIHEVKTLAEMEEIPLSHFAGI